MKPVKAICYPGTTFSPSLIRHSVLYFDKILILDPVVDSTKIKEEADEINDTLNSIDKNYFLEIAKDNVPFWMTLIPRSFKFYGNLMERRKHSLEFLRRIKFLGRKGDKKQNYTESGSRGFFSPSPHTT